MEPTPNAADAGKVRLAAERAAAYAKKLDDDLLWLLADERGRRLLGHLIYDSDFCHTMQKSLLDSNPTEVLTAMREGERTVGSKLLVWVESLSFDALLVMQRERHAARETEKALAEVERQEQAAKVADEPVHPYDGPVA